MIAGKMVDHLFPKVPKESLPPVQVPIHVAVDNCEDTVDLLLNLMLAALQLLSP